MSASALDAKPSVTAERQEFYDRLNQKSAAPLWEVLSNIVTVKPKPVGMPALWRFDELRPLLMEAGGYHQARGEFRRIDHLLPRKPGDPGATARDNRLWLMRPIPCLAS